MLSIQTLNKKFAQHFFETLYQDKVQEYDLVILQDRQSSARPVDAQGFLKTYLFYRVEAPQAIQWQTKNIVETEANLSQRTTGQRLLNVRVNFLGKNAITAATYFDHAINSEYAAAALSPVINGRVVEFQYNNHTPPVDLTEIELTKWVARVEIEVRLGYIDSEDFPLDVFQTVEVTEQVVADGMSIKPIIVTSENKEI